MEEGDYLQLSHVVALMQFHLKILNPWELITEDKEGKLDFTQFAEIWAGLEWVLARDQRIQG